MSYQPGIIIQARRGSSRLPDKVIRPFINESSILEILIDRFSNIPGFTLVVATTNEPDDDLICEICENKGVMFFRGSSNNVLKRFYDTSTSFMLDPIIRICSDNPFLLPSSPQELLDRYTNSSADYIGYRLSADRIGITTHFGLWAELLSRDAMAKVLKRTDDKMYLEHVSNYLYTHPEEFDIDFLDAPDSIYNKEGIRLTVDTYSDFELTASIYNLYSTNNSVLKGEQLIQLIESQPEWKLEMQKSISDNEK